jgi:hypothetical protein
MVDIKNGCHASGSRKRLAKLWACIVTMKENLEFPCIGPYYCCRNTEGVADLFGVKLPQNHITSPAV